MEDGTLIPLYMAIIIGTYIRFSVVSENSASLIHFLFMIIFRLMKVSTVTERLLIHKGIVEEDN